MKAKNKRILKIFLISFLVIGYIIGFGVIFNLKNIIGIGRYTDSKTFSSAINGSSGGLNIDLYAQHNSQLYHFFGYDITTFSTGDVEVLGMSYVEYRVRTGGLLRQTVETNFTTPRKSYSWDGYTTIRQNQNYTIQGFADVVFVVNSVNETHRIFIDVGIIIELDGEEINYEWGNVSTWLNVIYLTLTVIPLTLLYRNIKALRFEKWYNEEIEERDQKFFRILSKENEE